MTNQTNTLPQVTKRTPALIDEKEAAAILAVTPGTLSVWRSTGRYNVPFVKVGRCVRYSRIALEEWLESRTRSNGATA